ncbi:TonB-dependent receptor [Sphingobium sufflavum]|uniref:TonB-dependent receptor n=1 Tax=Sphingobium sufflavum TaxID=1129547 RepID=UPI001F4274AF|nr:TonB-dependent receptor [Sphingobium sufflavum]MCE7796491.1 TonB-dependent receptor [Sphingobium sufflavum]
MNRHSILALGLSVFAIAAPAYAQTPQPTGPQDSAASDNDIIIVEARRRDETLQDVPLVVNAVTAQTIEKLNIRNFQDITNVVPGLTLSANPNGIGSSSSLRGVNHDVFVSGENGTVQYYLNDSPIQSSLIFQAMYDIGQIEVLRGPQGTLRGRATPSGSITIASRKPNLREAGGYVMGTLGSAATTNFNAAINVPIIEDKLAVRIAGLHDFNRGDRVYSVNSGIAPKRETESLRASVRFEPVDFLKLGFTYQTLQGRGLAFDQAQSYAQINPSAVPSASAPNYGTISPSDRLATARTPRDFQQKFKYYNWNAELALGGQSLIYVGSVSNSKFHAVTPSDQNNFFPNVSGLQTIDTISDTTTHEVRLQNQTLVLGLFDYVVGYFHSATTGGTTGTIGTVVPLGGSASFLNISRLGNGGNGRLTEESFFGNATLHLGEKTEISGGVRRIQTVNRDAGLVFNGTLRSEALNNYDITHTIYSASIRHRFTDSLMVYAATGSSWRPGVVASGDFNAATYTPIEVAHVRLAPETSKSYEIGVKSDWFNRKLTLNLTYYHQDFKNYPFRASGAGIPYVNYQTVAGIGTIPTVGQFNFVSAVPVKVDGVEAEIGFNPTRRLSIGSTINYAKSKIGNALLACADALNNATGAVGSDGIPDAVIPTVGQMLAAYGSEHLAQCPGGGQRSSFQPDWSGSVRADYNHPLTGELDGFVRGLFAWKGKSFTDPNNRFDDVGAYGLLNLYAGLRANDGGWEISAYAKNVTNITKTVSVEASPYQLSGVATVIGRYSGVTVTPPREFGVTARFAIGSR